jgi:hypothetical protein
VRYLGVEVESGKRSSGTTSTVDTSGACEVGVRKAPCAELAELRSAFVDGALSNSDRDRLLRHLVDCTDCRRDIEDLRAVRQLLNKTKTEPGATPTDLSLRLVSIAGTESVAPLWTRPFRRTPATRTSLTDGLPSRRRTVKLRATACRSGCRSDCNRHGSCRVRRRT